MTKKATFPNALNDFYKTNGVDARTVNNEPSMARQEFAEECDINSLMKRYEGHVQGPGGLPPMGDPQKMFYADFTALPSTLMEYHEFMDKAQVAFMALPATVRREFDNSPEMFVEFASDPENLPQMRTWGLAPPAKPAQAPADGPAPGAKPEAPIAPSSSPAGSGTPSTHGST